MNDKWKNFTQNMFKIGTPECALFFGASAMVLALLFLTVGFWETVLIAALVCVGAFIGGVKDKKEWVRKTVNRLFPPRKNVLYREERSAKPAERAAQEMHDAQHQEHPEE